MSLKKYYELFKIIKSGVGTKGALQSVALEGLNEIGNLLDTFAGRASIAVGATAILVKSIQALSDAYNLSYNSAIKNTKASLDSYNSTKTEIEKLNTQADTAKDALTSLADTYSIKLDGTESINELIDKLKSSDLSLTDKTQVSKIESETSALERQLAIKQRLLEYQQKEAASNAIDTLKLGEESVAQKVAQDVPGGKRTYQGLVNNTNVVQATKDNVKSIKEYEKAIADLEEKQLKYKPNSKEWKNSEKDIISYNKAIEKLYSDIESKEGDLTTLLNSFSSDGQGTTALSGYEEQFKVVQDALNSINNINLSPAEKSLKALDSYFSGSDKNNFIKSQLESAYKDGKNLETELSRLGLSLDNLGVDNVSQLESYFKKVTSAASDAAKTVKDYSSTVSDVEGATSSENQDNDWSVIQSAYKNAKELIKEGKTGTDDVQSMAKFLNPKKVKEYAEQGGKYTADAYQKAIQDISATADRWFGEDETTSMENFVKDFKNKGLWNVTTDDMGLWDIQKNFSTTAEAADKFGMSVNSVETMLHGLEAYGYDFSDVMFSGEGLNRYETALNNIKSLYDGMEEGSQKDRLGGLIGNWDSELQGYQNDMSLLTEDQIVHIEFEYNLASIQQKIDEVKGLINGGDDTVSNHAQVIAGNQTYIETAKKGAGLNTEGVKIPVAYEANENSIKALQSQINKATSGEDKKKIQVEVENLQGLQQQLLNTFSDLHPEINADSSMDEINTAWESFVSSAEGQEIIAKIDADDAEAKQRVAEILGVNPEDIIVSVGADTSGAESKINGVLSNDGKTIVMDVDATTEQVEQQINELQNGQTLVFTAEVDGVRSGIEAVKNEDGTITYTANINGVQSEIDVVKDQDGSVTYHKASQEEASDSNAGVNYTKTSQQEASNSSAGVNYVKTGQQAPSPMTASVKYVVSGTIGAVKKGIDAVTGSGGLTGTAHTLGTAGLFPIPKLSGRALAMGTLEDDSWLKPQWKTKKTETALTGETGVEMVVHGNRWWTVGDNGAQFSSIPQGSVIFNAKQTKQLLEDGFTPSRAKGSVYLKGLGTGSNSYMSGTAYRLGSGTSSKSKSKPSSAGKSATSAAKSSAKAASSAENAAKEFKEAFDHIEIWVSRMERAFKNLVDSIGRYSNDLNKQLSLADQAINSAKGNISILQQAYDRYIQEANNVGLADNWKNVIHNGEIQISQITDEDLKDKIDEYQKWYEKALDMQDKILDLEGQILDIAIEKLENIETYFTSRFDYNDQFGYANQASQFKEALDKYTNELNIQVNNGIIKEFSKEWYDAQKQIAEYTDSLFEATLRKYDDIIQYLTTISDKFNKNSDVVDAKGEKLTEKDYLEQLETTNKLIDASYKKRAQLMEKQAVWDVGSEKYNDFAKQIEDVDNSIYDSMETIEELKNAIWEIRWQPFFDAQEAMSDLIDETDEFRDLLDSDSFVDKNGGLTSNGLVNLTLISQGMNTAKQQIRDYQEAVKKLDEDLQKGNISTSEYEEKQKDFLSAIRDSVGVVEDYKNEIIDLWKTQIRAENDVIQESIDKHKELLRAKKDNDDYSKNIRNQTKDINAIKAQMSALQGVNNESAKAELKRLQAQLSDAEDDLKDTRKEHEYDVREKGYDTTSDNLNKALEDTLDKVAYNAQMQEQVISNMLNNVLNNYSSIYGKINEIIANTGFTPSKNFGNNISNVGTEADIQNQVHSSNTIAPEYTPGGYVGNIDTSEIVNKPTVDKNNDILNDINKTPDINNRPVAEITLSPSSISVQEGSSKQIAANVRPTDAKNRTVVWISSDPSVASVADGNVRGVKPGSAMITCSAVDGSGKSATASVTVTKKPDPPKPAPQTGGDGTARVGDRVTLNAGQSYFYDSWGKRPAGNLYAGVPNGVVIDGYSGVEYGGASKFHGGYGIHIKSADGRYGDLGWVSLSQISGYKLGTKNAEEGLHFTDEKGLGSELLLNTKYGVLRQIDAGTRVFNDKQADALWDMSKGVVSGNITLGTSNTPAVPNANNSVVVNIESMIGHIDNVTKESLPGLEKIAKYCCDYTTKTLKKEFSLRWGK